MTEDDVRVENATIEIKRHYKQALANLDTVKADTANILKVKEKVEEELAVAQGELSKTKNDISQEKLDWAAQKHEDMVELENKRSEADNVIKRKSELNQQEETIRQVEAAVTELRNENRNIELKMKDDRKLFETEQKELVQAWEELEADKAKFIKDKEEFKSKVLKEIKNMERL